MGISIWQLLIILAIVLVLFGAKRLRNVGSDLGGANRGFRKAMHEEEKGGAEAEHKIEQNKEGATIEGEVTSREQHKDKA